MISHFSPKRARHAQWTSCSRLSRAGQTPGKVAAQGPIARSPHEFRYCGRHEADRHSTEESVHGYGGSAIWPDHAGVATTVRNRPGKKDVRTTVPQHRSTVCRSSPSYSRMVAPSTTSSCAGHIKQTMHNTCSRTAPSVSHVEYVQPNLKSRTLKVAIARSANETPSHGADQKIRAHLQNSSNAVQFLLAIALI